MARPAGHDATLVRTLYDEHGGALLAHRGRSVAEAAATLGVPRGTVQSRTFYALRALRVALDERGVTAT
jgi:RNA polymerase sigma-70 factor (ECF subfamily)